MFTGVGRATNVRRLRRLDSLYGSLRRRLERFWLERWVGFPREASKPIPLEEVGLAGVGRERYGPSPYGILGRVLRRADIGPEDVFIDFGCGMGRVLYEAAARFAFKRVVGVDLVPEFTAVARDVLARNSNRLRCREVEVVTSDVLIYPVPPDVTVAYFGAAFGEPILNSVLDKLAASADDYPRTIRLISYAPTAQPPELEEHPRVRLVRRGRRLIRRWAPADHLYLYEIRARATDPG
jgi:SAM-dependent methyltransferase